MPSRPADKEALQAWDRYHVWHAFTQMAEYEPQIIVEAQGCVLTDIDGNEYIDGVSSLWCNVHGHRHPRLDAAIREQLDRVAHVTSLGMSNDTTIQLARRLVEIVPAGLQHVFYSDSGASAVEVALKMAFQYWQQRTDPRPAKTRYVALSMAYHGDTLGSVSVGGMPQFHAMFAPLLFRPLRLSTPDRYRRPAGVSPERATAYYLAELREILMQHHHEIAAVVIEPLVQGAAGMIMHPSGYLQGVRELTREFDVLMIADEVAVGFGRTGKMFACEHEGVTPDLLCLAKGITAGYLPLAATVATTEIWNAFLATYAEGKTFYHGHTYGGNPLAAAVALANLELFRDEETLAGLPVKIEHIAMHLAQLAMHPHVGHVRQCGMIAAVELSLDPSNDVAYPWQEKRGMLACRAAMEQGVWLRPLGNVIVVMPPLAISLEQIDQIFLALRYGIDHAT